MAKWQLTVEKNGVVLEKHGGCSRHIKQRFVHTLGYILATSNSHYTITISKYTTMKYRKKKIVRLLTLEQKSPDVKRLVDFNPCK